MDFAMLPPEINSGRMYAGPGSAPMLAAASAWDGLAAEMLFMSASYGSLISGLTAAWMGPSSVAMAALAASYGAWISVTGVRAEETATHARAAATAYETAFAATVPPPVVAANRSLLVSLIATNLLGQNNPAIAATEADYAEMWAQDAAAMYDYAGSSAIASAVTPFSPPPRSADPAGRVGQAAAVSHATSTPVGTNVQTLAQLMSATPLRLQNLAMPTSSAAAANPTASASPLSNLEAVLIGPYNPLKLYSPIGSNYDFGLQNFLAAFNRENLQIAYDGAVSRAAAAAGGPGSSAVSSLGDALSAKTGSAGLVGGLSVPQGWATAAPAMRPVAFVLSPAGPEAVSAALGAEGQSGMFSNMALSGLAGQAIGGTGGTAARPASGVGHAIGEGATTVTIIVIPADE